MDTGKVLLMVMLYMLSIVPLFTWLLLGGTGTINMDPGTFDAISFILMGFTIVMLFIVMPFIVLPRMTGSDKTDENERR